MSPKGGALKGKGLALEGLSKGAPNSPKQETKKMLEQPRAPMARASPRGKALQPESTGGGGSGRHGGKMDGLQGASSSGGTAADRQALQSLHERHVSLQQEHATLQQAHAALQAKHRDSVGSCLVLLDQLKELQGRSRTRRHPAAPPWLRAHRARKKRQRRGRAGRRSCRQRGG